MDDNSDLHRLEGSDGTETGGLIVKKKQPSDHTFKKPLPSSFGLDKLAEQKRRENSQEPSKTRYSSESRDSKDRRYRSYAEETPTYTGGVDKKAQEKLEARLKRQRLEKLDRERDRDRRRNRSRDRDRDRDRDSRYSDKSSRRDRTPRFRDEPRTPKYKIKVFLFYNLE